MGASSRVRGQEEKEKEKEKDKRRRVDVVQYGFFLSPHPSFHFVR
jgi:hypothetical protein